MTRDSVIRCAMTDEQYHKVMDQLSAIDGLLELVQPRVADTDAGMIIGIRTAREKTEAAVSLMSAAWDRTKKTRAGGNHG